MPNRFVRKIRSGEIESIEALKSEFKEQAKLTHPDLRGPGDRAGAEAEFVAVRDEYEAALRGFERHRFGARPRDEAARAFRGDAAGADAPLSDQAWACLALLLKRGFPKSPRHEKEKLRYEYALWRLGEALDPGFRALFRDFESELLDQKAMGSQALGPELALIRDLLEYRVLGLTPLRTRIVLSLGALGANPGVGPAFRSFARSLARGLGVGIELGG
jgi:hypothetical protein